MQKLYSTQYILICLIEEWKTQLDKNKIVGVVLLHLSKALTVYPHDPIIAKLDAYGFEKEALSLIIYPCLKSKKQSVRINNVYGTFLEPISGVPQVSVFGALHFNIFLNDLYFFITKALLCNYIGDNNLSAYSSDLNSLTDILIEETQTSISWLKANHMMVNPKNFEAMLASKRKNTIPEETSNSVKLLEITLDNKVNFEKHIGSVSKFASC